MIMKIGLLVIVSLLATGQYLFKQIGVTIHGRSLANACWSLFVLPQFYLAGMIYMLATVLWIFVLSRIPLTEAYPWIACATVAVPLIGWFFYSEQVTPVFWLGIFFVAAGLALTQLGIVR